MKLSVNIDHIATIRQARMTNEPDPVYAAVLAEMGGADGITVHLRQDRRHIQERDVEILRRVIKTKLNMEMAVSMEMVKIALKYKPDVCTLVPESKDEVTTSGGLDVIMFADKIQEVAGNLMAAGIGVSLFIDPGIEQVKACHRLGIRIIEFNTGDYATNAGNSYARLELEKITKAVNYAKKLNFTLLAGHGLTYQNIRPIAAMAEIEELNIGHSIVANAAFLGTEGSGGPHEGAARLLKKIGKDRRPAGRGRPGRHRLQRRLLPETGQQPPAALRLQERRLSRPFAFSRTAPGASRRSAAPPAPCTWISSCSPTTAAPTLPASAATAWINDTLLIGGSEFSLQAGHLAAAGYRVPGYVFPPEAQEAIDEVDRDGGVTFISHPLDRKIPWTDWRARRFTGIEILSLYQLAKKNLLYGATLFPLQYLLNPDYALTSLISYPQKEMAIWDRCNRDGRYYGIYALDAHAKLPFGKKSYLRFPTYEATFRILTVYVTVDRELDKDARAAAATIIAALRRGNFFSVIESLAAANGFEYYYLEADGRRVEMGGDAGAAGGTLVLKLPFPFSTDILIRRDGEVFRTMRDNSRQEVRVPISEPGVYRCEVSLHAGRFSGLPWILANPIFVARPAAPPAASGRRLRRGPC